MRQASRITYHLTSLWYKPGYITLRQKNIRKQKKEAQTSLVTREREPAKNDASSVSLNA